MLYTVYLTTQDDYDRRDDERVWTMDLTEEEAAEYDRRIRELGQPPIWDFDLVPVRPVGHEALDEILKELESRKDEED